MAWNGSEGAGGSRGARTLPGECGRAGARPSRERGRPRTSRHNVRGLVALAIVVVGGGLAWWIVAGRRAHVTDVPVVPRAPSLIKEHQPVVVTNAPKNSAEKSHAEQQAEWKRRGYPKNPWGSKIPADLEYKPHWLYTEEDYARIDPSYFARHAEFKKRSAANPWKTTSDSQLSTLLFADPSQPNLSIPFDRHFVKQFVDSLDKPIVIDPEKDSAELQEQKKTMIAVREALKKEMDAGNDITEILNAERETQLRLRGLRENLMANLREIEKTAASEQEMSDYIEAANQMLEKEGLSKVRMSLLPLRWRLMKENAKGDE